MRAYAQAAAIGGFLLFGGTAAAATGHLSVSIHGMTPHQRMPSKYTFCKPAPKGHITFGGDTSPPVSWSAGPTGTKSYAIVMIDQDVPADTSGVNKPGVTILKSAKRVVFYHWLLVDIPPSVHHIPAGADSKGVVPHGKSPGKEPEGVSGVNDYTGFLAGNPKMKGTYGGYDGPCPPWNDMAVHHYRLTVYALDVAHLTVPKDFHGKQAMAAIHGHVLAKGSFPFTYAVRQK